VNTAAGVGLTIEGVHAAYGRIEVLHGVDVRVPGGSLFALLGPNGAGKSTLLKIMNGRLRPTAGTVAIDGVPSAHRTPEVLARDGIVAIPEGRGVFPNLTVRDNLRMWTYRGGLTTAEVEARAYEQFPRLKERRRQLAGTLSGGEQQMLALARALIARPRLLLLDEPSLGLAPRIVQNIFRVLGDINREGTTILLVEQNARLALRLSHRAYVLEIGKIQAQGPSRELAASDVIAKAYLGESLDKSAKSAASPD
jgi:branched-chain amino acid transport system ATP-binding protein